MKHFKLFVYSEIYKNFNHYGNYYLYGNGYNELFLEIKNFLKNDLKVNIKNSNIKKLINNILKEDN